MHSHLCGSWKGSRMDSDKKRDGGDMACSLIMRSCRIGLGKAAR